MGNEAQTQNPNINVQPLAQTKHLLSSSSASCTGVSTHFRKCINGNEKHMQEMTLCKPLTTSEMYFYSTRTNMCMFLLKLFTLRFYRIRWVQTFFLQTSPAAVRIPMRPLPSSPILLMSSYAYYVFSHFLSFSFLLPLVLSHVLPFSFPYFSSLMSPTPSFPPLFIITIILFLPSHTLSSPLFSSALVSSQHSDVYQKWNNEREICPLRILTQAPSCPVFLWCPWQERACQLSR